MTHPCNECPNFTDGKCCHETKESFNLNDVVATAFDDLGDDKHIENHVSPQCIVRGAK